MSVTIDHELVQAEELGMRTIGQLLSHVQREKRLVVNLLIDGQEPDLDHIATVKRSLLAGHTVFVETAEPRQMALDALGEVELQLDEAERLKSDAVDLLQSNAAEKAMQKLSGCFSTWQNAQESITKTAKLLRLDLEVMRVDNQSLSQIIHEFADTLRSIKLALEARDFVSLCDILTYETTQTTDRWRNALEMMREAIA